MWEGGKFKPAFLISRTPRRCSTAPGPSHDARSEATDALATRVPEPTIRVIYFRRRFLHLTAADLPEIDNVPRAAASLALLTSHDAKRGTSHPATPMACRVPPLPGFESTNETAVTAVARIARPDVRLCVRSQCLLAFRCVQIYQYAFRNPQAPIMTLDRSDFVQTLVLLFSFHNASPNERERRITSHCDP